MDLEPPIPPDIINPFLARVPTIGLIHPFSYILGPPILNHLPLFSLLSYLNGLHSNWNWEKERIKRKDRPKKAKEIIIMD